MQHASLGTTGALCGLPPVLDALPDRWLTAAWHAWNATRMLKSNATSHVWPFGALAELVDNAQDLEAAATTVHIKGMLPLSQRHGCAPAGAATLLSMG